MTTIRNLRSLRSLNKYFRRYRGMLLWGIFFVVVSNFFAVVPAQVVRHAFDLLKIKLDAYSTASAPGKISIATEVKFSIFRYSLIIIGMALMKGLFMFFMRQTIIVMSRKIEFDMKNDIYGHLQKLSLAYYRSHNTGDLLARVSEDVSRVRMYIGPSIMYLINLSTLILLTVFIMLSVSVKLTILVLLPLPVLAVSIYYVNNITYNRSQDIQNMLSRITTFVQEIYSGIRVVKSFSAEKSVSERFNDEAISYKKSSLALVKVESLFTPSILLLIGLSTLITLFAGGREVISGRLTAGVIAEFFIYVAQLSWPVASLGWTTNLIQRAAASQARINQIMDSEPDIKPSENRRPDFNAPVSFTNVTFIYKESNVKALDGISFTVKPGEVIGITGRTGSGKSSIAQLLLRTYDPDSGEITLGNNTLKELNLGAYRKHIGYVPQDDFLFSETIANNMLFGSSKDIEGAERDKLLHFAAVTADLYNEIQSFPKGFDTLVGERGITLSGGQKQRVAIARAIINDPKLLILDDCFSAIDTNTEARILKNLSSIMKGKTSFIISHRVSTVKNANRIIVLDNGKIIEQGTHDELIALEGYYSTLSRKQQVEKELAEKTQ